jgi:hypothetical protein
MKTYLVQLVLAPLRVVDAGLVAIMVKMTSSDETIASWFKPVSECSNG